MAVFLRIAVLFGLGLGIGLLLFEPVEAPTVEAPTGELDERPSHSRSDPDGRLGPEWGRVRVRASTGERPSGVQGGVNDPLSVQETADESPRSRERTAGSASGALGAESGRVESTAVPAGGRPDRSIQLPDLPDPELEVRSGQTLSEIAVGAYGTARPELVEALARYNGLDDVDDLRAGTTLRLPERSRLDER